MNKKFHTIYDHNAPVSPNGGESMTDQQYLKECDVNSILKSYTVTGKLPVGVRGSGVSGDFSDVGDFQACLDKINRAKDEFAALPAQIRARFGNDPSSYVQFVLDPANIEECVRLGIRVKPEVKKRTAEEILESIEKRFIPPTVTPPKGGEVAA